MVHDATSLLYRLNATYPVAATAPSEPATRAGSMSIASFEGRYLSRSPCCAVEALGETGSSMPWLTRNSTTFGKRRNSVMSTTILFALGTVGAAVGRGSVGAAVGCVGAGDGAGGTEGRPVGSSEGPSVEKTVGMSAVGGAEGLDDGKNALGVDVGTNALGAGVAVRFASSYEYEATPSVEYEYETASPQSNSHSRSATSSGARAAPSGGRRKDARLASAAPAAASASAATTARGLRRAGEGRSRSGCTSP